MHPNAYLTNIRNVKAGLAARSALLTALEANSFHASALARQTSLSYSTVMHHLRLLEAEGILNRKGHRPYFWVPTGLGQKRLISQ